VRQLGSWPDPTPFEAEDGSAASALDDLIRGPGAALPGVLLLAQADRETIPAARDLAVRLARAWVRSGRRTILADLDFEAPGLHALVGAPNDQGIGDHFAFGTALAGLAHPVDDGTWSVVPAGPWVADPEGVMRSPGWGRLLRDLSDRDATVLAFAPANAPGIEALAAVFGAVMALGSVGDQPGIRGYSVLACFSLPDPSGEQPAARAETGETPDQAFERIRLPTDARTREALIADLRLRQRAARMAPPADYQRPSLADLDAPAEVRPVPSAVAAGVLSPEAAAAPAEPVPTGPPPEAPQLEPPRPEEPLPSPRLQVVLRRRSYTPLWWTIAVIALLSLLAGSWHFVRGRLAAGRAEEADGLAVVPPAGQPDPAMATSARAADPVLAYAVSLGEQVRLPSAEDRAGALRSARAGIPFFISPVVRDEALYYDVLAGPVADSAAAAGLLEALPASGSGAASGAAIRLAPYAFLLGDYGALDSAEARVAALRRLEIPSYTIPLAGPPPRFRVYAGSYTGPVDAEVMKQILQSVGEPDVLVPRLGKR
jgi:cell division septation protein DedD